MRMEQMSKNSKPILKKILKNHHVCALCTKADTETYLFFVINTKIIWVLIDMQRYMQIPKLHPYSILFEILNSIIFETHISI